MRTRRVLHDSMLYAAAQYVYRVLLMARGLIAARLLGPLSFGAWNAIQLVMDYGLLATGGTFQGLDQTVPPHIVDGDVVALDRIKRAGLFNVLVLSLLYGIAAFAYLGALHGKIQSFWGTQGVVIALVCVVLSNLGYYHLNLLRAHNNIPAVSGWFLIQGVIGAGLALAFLHRYGVWALLVGWLVGVASATAFTLGQVRGISPAMPRASSASLELIRIGAPMYLFSVSTMLRSLDRIIILKFLNTLALGYYSLAVTAMTLLLYVPDSVSYVLYPQLLKRYRAGGNSPEAIRAHVERTIRALAVLVPAMCGLAYLLSRDFMAALLPKFLPGLAALRLVCFGAGGLSFVGLSAIVLMTLGRQVFLVPAVLAGALVGAALDYVAVRLGFGITGVGFASMVAYLLNGMVMLLLASHALDGTWRGGFSRVARSFLPLAGAFGIAYGIDRFLPWPVETRLGAALFRMLAESAIFLPLYAAVAHPFARGTGLRQMLMELKPGWTRRTDNGDA